MKLQFTSVSRKMLPYAFSIAVVVFGLLHKAHGGKVFIKCNGAHLLKDFQSTYSMRLLVGAKPLMFLESSGFAKGEENILNITTKSGSLSSGTFETLLNVDVHILPFLECDLFGKSKGTDFKTSRFTPEIRLNIEGPQNKSIRSYEIEHAKQLLSRVECSTAVGTNRASWSWEVQNKSSGHWGPVSSDLINNEPLVILDDCYQAKSTALVFGNQTLRCSVDGNEVGRISVGPISSAKGQYGTSSLVLIAVIFVNLRLNLVIDAYFDPRFSYYICDIADL